MRYTRKLPGAAVVAAFLPAFTVLVWPGSMVAQGGRWRSVSGQAVVAKVTTGSTNQVFAADTLSTSGGMAQTDFDNVNVPSLVTAAVSSGVSAGAADGSGVANMQSVAAASNVSVLNGLITASRVIAIASTLAGDKIADANSDGSSISDLVINGTSYGPGDATLAPNTRVTLPGVGYAILNERIVPKGGAPGITVNMIHVVLQGSRTGDIIVGSATSGAGR